MGHGGDPFPPPSKLKVFCFVFIKKENMTSARKLSEGAQEELDHRAVAFELTPGCTRPPRVAPFSLTSRRGACGQAPAPGAERAPPPAEQTLNEGKRNLERNLAFPVAAEAGWARSFSPGSPRAVNANAALASGPHAQGGFRGAAVGWPPALPRTRVIQYR